MPGRRSNAARITQNKRGGPVATLLICLLLVAQVLAAPWSAQAQTAVGVQFLGQPKTSANGDVQIHLSALGPDGLPIQNLSTDAFSVTEDGSPVSVTAAPDDEPAAISLLLDESKNMFVSGPVTQTQQGGQPPRLPIERAKEIAVDLVSKALDGNYDIAFVTFNGSDTYNKRQNYTGNQMEIISAINSINAAKEVPQAEGTCLYDALYRAEEDVNTTLRHTRAVIVITNNPDTAPGKARCSRRSAEQVVNKATATNGGTPIYALGISESVDVTTLLDISNNSNGKFALANNPDQLDATYKELAQRLGGRYLLKYRSNATGGSHSLHVDVNPGNNLPTLSGDTQLVLPAVAPKLTQLNFDPPLKNGTILQVDPQGVVRISSQVDQPARAGKIEYVVRGPSVITYTASGPSEVWNWDTTPFLAGQNSVTATLEVRAFNTTGKSASAAQPLELTLQAPVRPSNTEWVLPAIGIVAFLTLLLTLFMFFSRGRGVTAAGTSRKPAIVTKGEPLAQLIVTEGPGLGRQQEHFLYGDRSVSLGRDEDQSIQLPGERISRTHGEIVYRRNQFYYTDIKATNGTTVDGVPVPKGSLVPLKDGSELVFGGQTRAIFRLRPAGMAASTGQYQPLPTEARPPTVAGALPPVAQTELRTTEWVRETPLGAHEGGTTSNGGKDGKQS